MTTPSTERPRGLLRWPTYVMGQLHRSAVVQIDKALADEGLSLRDYYVLACLAEGGELAQQQVADRLGMDRSELVKMVDRLEAAGRVVRRRDTEDRRRQLLTLTDQGRAAVIRTEEISQQTTDALLDRLTPREREMLHRLLLQAAGEAADEVLAKPVIP